MKIERIFNNTSNHSLDIVSNILIDILIKDHIAKSTTSTTEELSNEEVAA